jgi:hypothetical protein
LSNGYRGLFPKDKAASMWSWAFIPIHIVPNLGMRVELYLQSLHALIAWCLIIHQEHFTVFTMRNLCPVRHKLREAFTVVGPLIRILSFLRVRAITQAALVNVRFVADVWEWDRYCSEFFSSLLSVTAPPMFHSLFHQLGMVKWIASDWSIKGLELTPMQQ